VLLIIFLPLGYFFGGILVKPIIKLRQAAEKIGEGELDHRIELATNDELEDLAAAFNVMTQRIRTLLDREKHLVAAEKERRQELELAKNDLEDLTKNLEKKVQGRTSDLARSQRATLNIMEDLQEAYNKLKTTQAQLIQAAKMEVVGRLASGTAHEVKNPLGIIIMGLDYLSKKMKTKNKEMRETIVDMRKAVDRADSIVRGLLDFSKVTELQITPVDINKLIDETLRLVKHDCEKYRIKVVKKFDKKIPPVTMDRNKIEQVLLNLFLNAIQAMPKRKNSLTVRTSIETVSGTKGSMSHRKEGSVSEAKKCVVVEIEDTGPGIPKETLDKIFDPFFTTKRAEGGAGLGLPVVESIIDMHKGMLIIENKKEEHGVIVTVSLPIAGGG